MNQCILAENLAWHTMYLQTFSKFGRQTLGRLLVWQASHVRAPHCMDNCSRKWLFTDRQTAIHDRYLLQTSRAAVSHARKHGTGQHTAWQGVYNGDRHIRFQHIPVLVISALYSIFWGLSALPLDTDCISLHVTSKASSDSVQQLQATLSKWTLPL